uniref:Uncharacterized protein n=1 Tax=Anguilla anguilla TaxID=7936 RepID=A0A0E9TQX5_ANGAN
MRHGNSHYSPLLPNLTQHADGWKTLLKSWTTRYDL